MFQDEEKQQRIRRLVSELRTCRDEDRQAEIIELLDAEILDPCWMNYIYHSDEFQIESGFDMDGFIRKIESYRPILL